MPARLTTTHKTSIFQLPASGTIAKSPNVETVFLPCCSQAVASAFAQAQSSGNGQAAATAIAQASSAGGVAAQGTAKALAAGLTQGGATSQATAQAVANAYTSGGVRGGVRHCSQCHSPVAAHARPACCYFT